MALARRYSAKAIHILCLLCGAAGLGSVMLFTDPKLLLLSMTGVGIAWASILSMPYAMLSGAVDPKKMGLFMGIFNFFIVIPQVVASLGLGLFVKQFLGNDPVGAVAFGGLCFLLAALLTFRVQADEDVAPVKSASV
jgi:maltose/moltooligosaccharide transporter